MFDLIDLSLDLFKMESGQFTYNAKQVDLMSVVQTVRTYFAEPLSRKQLSLVLRHNGQSLSLESAAASERSAVMVAADARLLLSMLGNLLTNAVEASPPGETILLDIREHREADAAPQATQERWMMRLGIREYGAMDGAMDGVDRGTNDRIRFDICNCGAVPALIRERFFEKYCSSGKPNGTGLGTYSAKIMADTMGFRLSMSTSDVEDRTCVHLWMPASQQ